MANNNSESGKSVWETIAENFNQAVEQKNRSVPEELSVSAPYAGAVVQPSGYAPTAGGTWGDVAKSIYNNTMSRYNELKGLYQDQTEEAKKIRSSWQTAPTVRLENGRFKLSGSSDFLKSAEAKQLRDTLKEMEGNSYNTEDLNRQIEAWNTTLSKMSEQYMNSLGTLNSLNAALAQNVEGTTREDFQKYFTFNDLQKIGNSAAVGKQNDARTTKSKIFVGFEWDDNGNMIEKWVNAADFFNEFNNQSDDEKRSAYHSLVTQANLGDVGAYSKLMYLQGGSQGGPANVDIDGAGVFFENILHGAEAGAAGVLQDIFDYAPILNLRTIGGNISNAAENAEDRDFWDWAAAVIAPGLYADKYDTRTGLLKVYNDAVTDFNNLRDWSNTYTAELNPASTEIGRGVGDVTGGAIRIAGDIYAFGKLGALAADTKFAAMQIANQKFAGSKAFTPMGQIYIKKYGVRATDQVTPLANNGGVATMGRTLRDTTTVIPFGGIYVPTVLTKISPKFTQFLEEAALAFTEVQFARNASQFISKDGTTVLQFGAAKPAGTKIVWSDKGVASVVEPMTQAQWSVEWGNPQTFTSGSNIRSAWDTFSKSAGSTVSDSKVLSNTINFSRSYELLKSLRNKDTVLGISKGLQTAQALSNLVGFAAMRNVDEYFQRVEAGEDVGDMADYIITHTAEDAVWGGLIMKAGGMMKFFKRGADASAKPTVEYVQEVFDGMKNSQSGWYMPGTYASNRFSLGPGELTSSESADLADTLSSIMTTNGEAIVGFSGELGGVSAVPGTNIKEAGKALGVYSPSKITRLSVQPANGGAYLIREETNLDTNTKVETRQFYTDIEEATKAAGSEAVPKTTPATIANSDVATGAKVAPLTIDGKAPNVMPDGVSQIRVEPGIVYRTPDNVAESLINIAAQEGWHETNQDRLYREYEQYQREVEAQQNAMEILSAEAPALPREMYGTDIESILRIAAAAKVAGYNYIPFKTSSTIGRADVVIAEEVKASKTRVKELESDFKSAEEQVERDKTELAEVQPETDADKITKFDYQTRAKLAKNFVEKNPEYVVAYRRQPIGVDNYYSNGTSRAGDPTEFISYGSDKGDLNNAVWLTTDKGWADSDEAATANAFNGEPDQTLVVLIPKSLIVDAGGERPPFDPELGPTDMTGLGVDYYSLRRFSELNGGKIVLTRVVQLDTPWIKARDAGVPMAQINNRLNPKYWNHQELVLFKDLQPELLDNSNELLLAEYNAENSVSNKRAISRRERNLAQSEKIRDEIKDRLDAEKRTLSEIEQRDAQSRIGNFIVSAYGVPFEYFPTAEEALDFASQNNVFEVHELSDEPMTLDRPPVTTENISEPLLLESGASAENHLERLTGLLQSMQEMEDSDINYSYGIIDALKQVRGIYSQVSANVNLTDIYARYAQSIYDGEEIKLTPDERKALKPLTDALDALGHYFDPSGKSLTKEFYLPTGAATRNKVSIEEALLGKDEITDVEFPADGGLEEILIDADRIGDSGFWQKRTGELFMDSEGNFTMSKAAPLEDNLIAYTVSALTRGPHKLTLAVNNEVARSKANPNRTQITAKQARAMLQEADTLRTKTRAFQLGTHKDAEKIAKLKMDYSGDESTVDQALKEKKYAKKLNYTRTLNTLSQKGGFNQFLDIHPIKGSVTRFGAGPYKGTANIKRKMSEINITGTMYKYDNGHWENYGFGIEPSQANIKKYGVFKDGGDPVNLGEILKFNFESQQRALDFYGKLKENLKNYAAGDGEALQVQLDTFARENFPLHTNIDSFSAKLMKEFGKNLYAYNNDVIAAEAANVDSVEKWLRTGSLICFNNAIQMGDIQNLDGRTIEALDDAAAELLLGSPVKRSAAINFLQRWSVDSALSLNANLVIGNVGSEIFTRLPGYVGTPETIRAVVNALRPSEFRRVRNILKDLPLHFDDSNSALARRVYNRVSEAVSKGEDVALSFLNWSELFKNVVYYLAGERNAIKSGITDPAEIGQQALNFVGEHAIAGGRGTTPGIAQSDLGRVLFIFKTFTIRNFDDFLDFVKKASHGRSGDNYWDKKYEKRHKGDDKDTIDLKIAARVIGGRAFRSYIFWLFVGSYLGKSLLDILGGDPTGILEGGYDRGLYDDPDTQEYEGMTDFDNFINNIPAGFILGALQDLYFAARRRGIESKQFFALDIFNDQRLQKDLSKKLPLGVAKNRLGDMLSLLDRGYSFSSTGKKTYAAPDTVWDLTKGFLFGKSTTANSLAYGKYRYGNVNIWGDISSGDWMDFAINANPLTDIFGGSAKFDTTRKDYTGVFDGSWNDIATMQLIVQDFKNRNKQIIADFQENKYKWTGDYQGLSDEEKLAKAKEQRDKDIDKFTDDVQRAVDAFEKAGNILSDKQISTMVNLFDFHEGEEDEEWNSSYARRRYVEAGLPDYNAATITRGTQTVDGEKQEVTKNILDRSLLLQNAQQGYYGSSKEAANAVKDTLKDFKPTYQQYNKRVKELNNKYFEARNKNKNSATTKQLSKELESLQNEYLDKLFDKLEPVMDEYGTALVGTYDVADALEDYMGNMIPYSSIRKYGQTYSSGNDIVYGQLTEWLQKRLGRNAPTAASDKEVTNGIADIKKLLDQGKTSAARSKARAILEKIGRGSLGARNYDVETLRGYAYD